MKLPLARVLPAILGTSCLLVLVACSGGSAGSASPGNIAGPGPDPSDPDIPEQEFVVRGELFSIDMGMIANAPINLWIESGDSGHAHPLHSDGLGLFETEVPPSVNIFLLAFEDGFVQPCAVRSKVTQDIDVRIEMLPESALNTISAPRPQLSFEPSVTGKIYEITQDGRQSVAGADLWADYHGLGGIGVATTLSDLGGGYYLCNLPTGTYLDVRKDGFKPAFVGPVGGPEPAILEIELERL
jgi:hypothetical protein